MNQHFKINSQRNPARFDKKYIATVKNLGNITKYNPIQTARLKVIHLIDLDAPYGAKLYAFRKQKKFEFLVLDSKFRDEVADGRITVGRDDELLCDIQGVMLFGNSKYYMSHFEIVEVREHIKAERVASIKKELDNDEAVKAKKRRKTILRGKVVLDMTPAEKALFDAARKKISKKSLQAAKAKAHGEKVKALKKAHAESSPVYKYPGMVETAVEYFSQRAKERIQEREERERRKKFASKKPRGQRITPKKLEQSRQIPGAFDIRKANVTSGSPPSQHD